MAKVKKISKKSLCMILALLMVIGTLTVVFTTKSFREMIEAKTFLSDYAKRIVSTNHVIGLDKTAMSDSRVIALKQRDGSVTSYGFSEPVTFKDTKGNLKAKDTSIVKQKDKSLREKGFDYTNGDNDYRVNIASDIRKGVNAAFNGSSFTLIPDVSVKEEKTSVLGGNGTLYISPLVAAISPTVLSVSGEIVENKADNTVSYTYSDIYGEGTSLSVEPQLNGVNEKIVLCDVASVDNISFTLCSEDSTPVLQEDGSIALVNNETKQVAQTIGAPILSTENLESEAVVGEIFGRGAYTLEENDDDSYTLGIDIPDRSNIDISEYGDLVITIPGASIMSTGSGHISATLDTGIYTGTPSACYNNEITACFGRDSGFGYGRALTYFTMPAAIKRGATIHSAYFWTRETTGETSTTVVQPFVVNDTWTSQTTWNTRPGFASTSTMSRRNISSNSGDVPGNPYWYKFNVAQAVNLWVKATKVNRGIIFKSEEETNHNYRWRAFATREYTTSSMRPYTIIEYTNDTTAPTLTSVTKTPASGWTQGPVRLTAVGASDSGAGLHPSPYSFSLEQDTYAWQENNYRDFYSNRTVYVGLRDYIFNSAVRATVVISNIDAKKPNTPTATVSQTGWSQSNVSITVQADDANATAYNGKSGVKYYSCTQTAGTYDWKALADTNLNGSYTFTNISNGTYYIYSKDVAGNICETPATVNVSNIDSQAPTAELNVVENTQQNNVTISVINASDNLSGLHSQAYSFSETAGVYDWQSSNTKTFNQNKTIYVSIRDTAGNIGTVGTVNITSIVSEIPVIDKVEVETSGSSKVITVEATDYQNDDISYSFDNGQTWQSQPSKTYTNTIESVSIKLKDNYEHISEVQTVNILNDLFYRDGQFIGIAADNEMYYQIGNGNWSLYSKPFTIPAFTSADISAKFVNCNVEYKQNFTSNNYQDNAYFEVGSDFTLNYKSISFGFNRIYSSSDNEWFYSTDSTVNTTSNSNLLQVVLPDSSHMPFVKTAADKYKNILSGYVLEQTSTGFMLKADSEIYNYNTNGVLTGVTNKYDDEITITRTPSSIIVSDEENRSYTVNLNNAGKVTSITDPAGNSIVYTYTGDNLTQVTDQAGVVIGQYSYSDGKMSKSMDKSIDYDSHGRVTHYIYDSNYHEDITYNDTLNKVSTATSSDNSTSVTSNDAYLPVESIYEAGSVCAYTYDNNYNVLTETVDGETTTNNYNSAGLLVSSSNSEGIVASYSYDSDNNLIREYQEGEYTYYTYNSLGDVLIQATLKEDYEGTIPTVFNANLDCFEITENQYSAGLLTQVEDTTNNETTAYTYDIYGNIASVTITTVDGEQTLVSETSSTYDAIGNVLTTTENQETSTFIYDKAGRILRSSSAEEVTRYLYDNYGRTIQEISPEYYNAECDGLNLSEPENTYSNSSAGKRYVYSSDFTLASETNELGVTTTYTYDSVTGTKSKEEYDIYTYYYLPHGEVSRIEADGELVLRYEYNSKYEVTLEAHTEAPEPSSGGGGDSGASIDPLSIQNIHYTYNSAGQLISQTRDGESNPYITYLYTNGELSEKINTDSDLRYVYANGEITVYKNSTNELLYSYEDTTPENSDGVLSSSETHFGTSVSSENGEDYSWQQIGNNNSHYSFTENNSGYVSAEQLKYNNSTVLSTSYTYDNSGNTTSKSYSGIATYQNTYDNNDRIITSSDGSSTSQYFYEDGQLVRVNNQDRNYTCTYTYDSRGNITSKKYYAYTTAENLEGLTPVNQDTFSYNFNRADQLVQHNNHHYTYDNYGNLTSDGTHSFDWANGSQLVSVGSDIAYTYDENGIRTSKEVDGTTTYFNTSDGLILSQSDGTDTLIFQYDNGSIPVGFTWNGTQYYYITNSSGDVLGICDATGELLVEYTYDEWGKLIDVGISANADEELAEINPLRYRGYYYDEETGFYYLQSRYYNPEICRFISQDSYTNTETGTTLQYNMFAYCENDPMNGVDKTGQSKVYNVKKIIYPFVTKLFGIKHCVLSKITISKKYLYKVSASFKENSKRKRINIYWHNYKNWYKYFMDYKSSDFEKKRNSLINSQSSQNHPTSVLIHTIIIFMIIYTADKHIKLVNSQLRIYNKIWGNTSEIDKNKKNKYVMFYVTGYPKYAGGYCLNLYNKGFKKL